MDHGLFFFWGLSSFFFAVIETGGAHTGSVHLKSPQNILSSVVCTRNFLLSSDSRNVCASVLSPMVNAVTVPVATGPFFTLKKKKGRPTPCPGPILAYYVEGGR